MSYRLSYADGARALRQHPIALGLFPLVLAVVTVGIAIVAASAGVAAVQSVTSFLISAVFITSGFHFVRQSYGVARIGFSYAKASLQPWENRALRLAVYPIWLVGLRPLLSDQGGIGYLGFEVGPAILNGAVFACLEAAAWIAVASVVAVYLRVWSRGVRPTGLMVAPYAVIVVWMIAPIGQIAAASLAFSLVHALQYLACCYRVERNRAGGEGIPGLVTWFYVVVVAACLGIVATRGLPGWLDQTWGTPGQPLLFSALAFVYLNLTHYVTDAVIWKSSGSLLKPRLHSG
ncbi:hypothetical protein SAMN05880545_0328 [Microbacterium sp. RU33B]|nr:hypothetical protein SAMN05880545_0328 [Microbacterium sp. RU33B]